MWPAKAKAQPRTTMATTASVAGTKTTVPSAPNARGKAEKKAVTTKISHTWLASQTGPMDLVIARRWAAAMLPRASRCRIPAPKSAPPRTA
jgi:hypothetical protein